MPNTTLTADIIASEALDILEGELVMANLVHRAHENEFTKGSNGYTVGDTLTVRRPTDFTVRDGATASAQDVVEGKTTITIDKQKGIDFKFTSADLTLKIGELSERVIRPAVVQLASQVDLDLMALYRNVPNHVTIPSGGIDSFADYALAPTRMDTCAIPQDQRYAILSPADHWKMLGSQTALYIQDAAKGAYRNAKLGTIGGVETYMSHNVPVHTTGTRTGTDAIDLTIVDGTFTWATVKNASTITIHIDGMAASTSTIAYGDTFTIAGLYDVHPVTKARLPHLKMFAVMEAATASSNETDVEIWPPIILSGAQKTCDLDTSVDGSDLDNNVVTWQGTASTNYTQNLFFHKNAFALCMVPMEKPPGAVDVARKSFKGLSIRLIPYYDGANDISNWRLDILYGVKCIDPRLAVRASLAADI
ncbi:MAG: hypothetical protein KIT43_10325 [Bauldia sp.]|nr:hypothetical protein [Bauldia sp.]